MTPLIDEMMDWKAYKIWTATNDLKAHPTRVSPSEAARQRSLYILHCNDPNAVGLTENHHLGTRSIHYYARNPQEKDSTHVCGWEMACKIQERAGAALFDSTTLMVGLAMGAPNGLENVYEAVRENGEFTKFSATRYHDPNKKHYAKKLFDAQNAGLFELSYAEIQNVIKGLAQEKGLKTDHFDIAGINIAPLQEVKVAEQEVKAKPQEPNRADKPSNTTEVLESDQSEAKEAGLANGTKIIAGIGGVALLAAGAIQSSKETAKKENTEKREKTSFSSIAMCAVGAALTGWAIWSAVSSGKAAQISKN